MRWFFVCFWEMLTRDPAWVRIRGLKIRALSLPVVALCNRFARDGMRARITLTAFELMLGDALVRLAALLIGDGASVPRGARWLVPPGTIGVAGMGHDGLFSVKGANDISEALFGKKLAECTTQERRMCFWIANQVFLALMLANDNVPRLRAYAAWAAVQLFGYANFANPAADERRARIFERLCDSHSVLAGRVKELGSGRGEGSVSHRDEIRDLLAVIEALGVADGAAA